MKAGLSQLRVYANVNARHEARGIDMLDGVHHLYKMDPCSVMCSHEFSENDGICCRLGVPLSFRCKVESVCIGTLMSKSSEISASQPAEVCYSQMSFDGRIYVPKENA